MTPFEIIGNGISLDVAKDSKLTTEFVATTFNESAVLAGSYTYPIVFPFTAKNIEFFEHSEHLENRSARKTREVMIVFFGVPWKTAVVDYTISREGYEATLKVDNGAVAGWMRDLSIARVFSSDNKGKLTHQSLPLGNATTSVEQYILDSVTNGEGYVWPTYLNSNMTGELLTGDDALINDFNNMTAVADTKLYSPWFFHTWIIRRLCEYMGYRAVGSYLDDAFIGSLIVYNTGARTGADWKEQKKINPAEHMPDMSIGEYIKIIRNDHRVMIYFDSLTKTAHFDLCTTLLESESRLNLCDAIHYDSLKIQKANDKAFKLLTKIDDNDELYVNVSYEKSIMVGYDFDNWKELQLGIGRLQMADALAVKGSVNALLPAVSQLGNIYSSSYNTDDYQQVYNGGNELSKNAFALRMMSYKGLQGLGTGSHRVPFCTGDDRGNGGVVYTNTMDQGGAKGWINKYTIQYYRFYCSSELVEVSVQMNGVDFFALQPLQKIMIADRSRIPIEALMDKVVFEPHSNHQMMGKISCYPNYDLLGSAQGMQVMVGGAVVESTEGVLFAKLFSRNSGVQANPDNPSEMVQFAEITIAFYADAAAFLPYNAVDFPYKIVLNKYILNWSRETGYYLSYDGEFTSVTGVAQGTRYVHGTYKLTQGQYYIYPSLEKNGKDLNVLGNYRWLQNDWVPIV